MSSALWPNHLHHKKRYVILDIFFQRIFFSEETQIQPRNQLKLTSNSSYGGIAIDKRQKQYQLGNKFCSKLHYSSIKLLLLHFLPR